MITENIYQNLKTTDMPDSVHLCDYPEILQNYRNPRLEKQMEETIAAVSLGRYLRSQQSLRVRQPLSEVIIVSHNAETREYLQEMSEVIKEELNVKSVKIDANEEELVTLNTKANFKILGKKLGKNMKEIAAQIQDFSTEQIITIRDGGSITLKYTEGEIEVNSDDVIIQRTEKEGMTVANDKHITVALNTVITEKLELEGLARELVNKIQGIRKDTELDVADRIRISIDATGTVEQAIKIHQNYITGETLAVEIRKEKLDSEEIELVNGYNCRIKIAAITQ
jgi:isoleucyl-tRNA synthetase